MSEILPVHDKPSLDDYVEAAWAGMDLEEYSHLISCDIAPGTIRETFENGGSLKDLHDPQTMSPNFRPRRLNREYGANYDGSSVFSQNKLLKLAGVKFRERREVKRDPSIQQYFYRSARQAGATHQGCMEAHQAGISLKDYSVLIQSGFCHEDIISCTLQLMGKESDFSQ